MIPFDVIVSSTHNPSGFFYEKMTLDHTTVFIRGGNEMEVTNKAEVSHLLPLKNTINESSDGLL
jgi:hypothetical protein